MTVSPELDRRFRDAAARRGAARRRLRPAWTRPSASCSSPSPTAASARSRSTRPGARGGAARPRLRRPRPALAEADRRGPAPARRVLRRQAARASSSTSTFAPPASSRRAVLRQLARVPYGELTTYGTLAARAGRPRAARAVGTVMNRNPVPIVLPCHRVVGSTGSLVGYAGGLDRKRTLLALEGSLPPA